MLVNELDGWLLNDKNGCRRRTHSNGEHYFFFSFYSSQNATGRINIDIDSKIKVNFLSTWNDEVLNPRKMQKSYTVFITRLRTRALLRNIPLFYYSKLDFLQLLHSFCSSFVCNKVLGYNDETMLINDLYNSFFQVIFLDAQ